LPAGQAFVEPQQREFRNERFCLLVSHYSLLIAAFAVKAITLAYAPAAAQLCAAGPQQQQSRARPQTSTAYPFDGRHGNDR
jgi:hypothetical protein